MIIYIKKLISFLIASAGVITLWAWFFSQHAIMKQNPELTLMAVNTALCFFIFGLFYLFQSQRLKQYNKIERGLAAVLIFIGVVVLCEYIFPLPFSIDEIFVKVVDRDEVKNPGRMSSLSATAFLMIGLAIMANQKMKTFRGFCVAHMLIMTVFLMGLFGIIQNELFDLVKEKYRFNRMADLTSFCFFGVSIVLWMEWKWRLSQLQFAWKNSNIASIVRLSLLYFLGVIIYIMILVLH